MPEANFVSYPSKQFDENPDNSLEVILKLNLLPLSPQTPADTLKGGDSISVLSGLDNKKTT